MITAQNTLDVFPLEDCLEPQRRGLRLDAYQLSRWLLAYLTWPNDPERRRIYIDAHELDSLACASQRVHQDVVTCEGLLTALRRVGRYPNKKLSRAQKMLRDLKKRRDRIEKDHLRPFAQRGGLKRLIDAPPLDALIRETIVAISRWLPAAQRLYITAQLSVHHEAELHQKGGAGIGKASALMINHALWTASISRRIALQRRTRINEAWAEFKPVVHLAAGALQAALELEAARSPRPTHYMQAGLGIDLTIPIHKAISGEPVMVLDRALAFQHFAIRHHSMHQSPDKRLLSPSSYCLLFIPGLWAPPVQLQDFLPPLSPDVIRLLLSRTNVGKGYWGK